MIQPVTTSWLEKGQWILTFLSVVTVANLWYVSSLVIVMDNIIIISERLHEHSAETRLSHCSPQTCSELPNAMWTCSTSMLAHTLSNPGLNPIHQAARR